MSTSKERAQSRRGWPSSKRTLGTMDEALADLSGQQAWDAVMELTAQAWSLAGGIPAPLPRSQWPSHLYRPGEPRPDSNGL